MRIFLINKLIWFCSAPFFYKTKINSLFIVSKTTLLLKMPFFIVSKTDRVLIIQFYLLFSHITIKKGNK
jgi:hypothetical protein